MSRWSLSDRGVRTLTSAVLPATLVLLVACSGPSAPAGTPTATARTTSASATVTAATTAVASPAASTPSATATAAGIGASGATGTAAATGTPTAARTPQATATAAPTTAAPPPPPPAAGPTTVNVGIANFAFAPASGNAPLIVRWTNNDTVEHDIIGADRTSSPPLAPGTTYERRFNAPGTFSYTCSFHPFMAGTVTIR